MFDLFYTKSYNQPATAARLSLVRQLDVLASAVTLSGQIIFAL